MTTDVDTARPASPWLRATQRGSGERPRVLLFDGRETAVSTAAPALEGLGVEVVRHELHGAPIESTARDVIAVVVSDSEPGTNGSAEVVRHCREVCDLPVLVLGTLANDDVLLQELGRPPKRPAEGCIPLELAQQIRAILRRSPSRVLMYDLLEIDTGRREVRVDRQPVELSRREFDLLTFLASSPRSTFSRSDLLQAVWRSSGEWQRPSTVTEHIRRIRIKLRTRPDLPGWIVTVRGIGYRFDP